jgi:hypothetical protein
MNHFIKNNGDLVNIPNEKKVMYERIKELFKKNKHTFLYCICFPYISNVSEKHKEYVRHMLEPTDWMKTLISNTMISYNLVANKYIVLHIRCGDSFLLSKKENKENKEKEENKENKAKMFDSLFIKRLFEKLDEIILNSEKQNFLIIADNNEIKKITKEKYSDKSDIQYIHHKIGHFGEGMKQEQETVQNSMLDFYLISMAQKVYSFTVYTHGSGFSRWCAFTYNIPYVDKYIGV